VRGRRVLGTMAALVLLDQDLARVAGRQTPASSVSRRDIGRVRVLMSAVAVERGSMLEPPAREVLVLEQRRARHLERATSANKRVTSPTLVRKLVVVAVEVPVRLQHVTNVARMDITLALVRKVEVEVAAAVHDYLKQLLTSSATSASKQGTIAAHVRTLHPAHQNALTPPHPTVEQSNAVAGVAEAGLRARREVEGGRKVVRGRRLHLMTRMGETISAMTGWGLQRSKGVFWYFIAGAPPGLSFSAWDPRRTYVFHASCISHTKLNSTLTKDYQMYPQEMCP